MVLENNNSEMLWIYFVICLIMWYGLYKASMTAHWICTIEMSGPMKDCYVLIEKYNSDYNNKP